MASTTHPKPPYPKPPFPTQPLEPPGLEEKMDPKPRYRNPTYKGADKLDGKVALITGGDSGIGRATAVLMAREKAKVAFTYLPEEEIDARKTLEGIQAEGTEGLAIAADVSLYEECQKVVSETINQFNKLNIIVNNAAVQKHVYDLNDLSIDQWQKTFATNINGYFYIVKAAHNHLKEGASIINVGSVTALEGSGALLDYSATKGAIHSFTRSLAHYYLKNKIRVNCVVPGPVWTPLNPAERPDEEVRHFGESVGYKRPAQPEEIAPACVFLASNIDSGYMTGETINLLGG